MEGEGGAACQAVGMEDAAPARELVASMDSITALLEKLSADQSARDKPLLERIRAMDEEVCGLREHILNLREQLSSDGGVSQSKKKKKNTKKTRHRQNREHSRAYHVRNLAAVVVLPLLNSPCVSTVRVQVPVPVCYAQSCMAHLVCVRTFATCHVSALENFKI